ncbi:MAG: hypothetical protein NTV00_16590 [Methylococcales bacterium]|nr:hypothetical protein [Methylococcales bacterium]
MTLLTACNKGNEIAGRSQDSASKSARYLKDRLPADQRLAFEVSFFTIRDSIKDGSAFLKAVDGKTPAQIIEKGKAIYTERKMAGVAEYLKYATWEEMLASFTKERVAQSIQPLDAREKQAHTVLYKL